MTHLDLETIHTHVVHAREELARLCRGHRWRMSIPAQPDRDSDLIFDAALKDVGALVHDVERLRAAVHKAHGFLYEGDRDAAFEALESAMDSTDPAQAVAVAGATTGPQGVPPARATPTSSPPVPATEKTA